MPDPVGDLVRLVRQRLADEADPARAEPMRAYMKSSMPYRGVTAQPLRVLCREVYGAHPLPDRAAWERGVRTLWDEAAYREERYAATALAAHRLYRVHQDPATLALYRHLVVSGAWWDHVDTLATHHVGGLLAAYPLEVTPVMRSWAVDDDLWLRRTAILCQLARKAGTDEELLRDVLEANLEDSLHGREFFVRKAVGWALRQHARVDPDWVRAFVTEHAPRLSGLSRREALKHL
jgi:3-methyladenine DNA glycosylase AlkD